MVASAFAQIQGRRVDATPEFYRVLSLPRRVWQPGQATELAQHLTRYFRQPLGEQALRDIQAIALYELHRAQGLFGIMRVGSGKTLVTLLGRYMVQAWRPMLLVPAKLKDKTRIEMRRLSRHWNIPQDVRIVSYELLGRPQAAKMLDQYRPDLIIADECHKLRNRRAAVTRRVARYMRENPETKFAALSGTITKRSLRDYSHLLRWCLGKLASPIPAAENELEEWADAIDEKVNPNQRMLPGALLDFADPSEVEALPEISAARRGYYRRLVETQGVVATDQTPLDCSISLQAVEPHVESITEEAFRFLRNEWTTPDGWPIADAMTLWRHARELALGFYYRWNPRPPDDWLLPRKLWAAECRGIIANSRTYDSEGQVANAIRDGHIDCPPYWDWKRVENSFVPNTEIVWFDYSIAKYIVDWLSHRAGICWVEHVQFAEALSQWSGCHYYGRGGLNANGQPIEEADPKSAIIASVASNSEGRNLQAWHRNLLVGFPTNGPRVEQLLGRTHRDGQQADEVTFDCIMSCIEHYMALEQSKRDARYVADTQGQNQKILYADLIFPELSSVATRTGPRWQA